MILTKKMYEQRMYQCLLWSISLIWIPSLGFQSGLSYLVIPMDFFFIFFKFIIYKVRLASLLYKTFYLWNQIVDVWLDFFLYMVMNFVWVYLKKNLMGILINKDDINLHAHLVAMPFSDPCTNFSTKWLLAVVKPPPTRVSLLANQLSDFS